MAAPDAMQDCVIVGGGPAALTAALFLARFLRSVTVFDADDGRARMIPATHNQPLFPDGIAGRDMLATMARNAAAHGARLRTGTVSRIALQEGLFHITADSPQAAQITRARRVILAMGVFNYRPPLSAEDHDAGLAAGLIRYCPVCDGFEVQGKRIAVLGQGQHASDEARFIKTYSPAVTLIPPTGVIDAVPSGIGVLEAAMRHISLSETEVVIALDNDAEHRFDALYVALGTTPRTTLAGSLGLKLNPAGYVRVDAQHRSSLSGVYAIGDLTVGLDQIAVAMGQGAIAATAVHNDLA